MPIRRSRWQTKNETLQQSNRGTTVTVNKKTTDKQAPTHIGDTIHCLLLIEDLCQKKLKKKTYYHHKRENRKKDSLLLSYKEEELSPQNTHC